MAIGNEKLMHKYFPKYSGMGTAKMKYDKESDKDCKKRAVRLKSKSGMKKISPIAYRYLIKIQ